MIPGPVGHIITPVEYVAVYLAPAPAAVSAGGNAYGLLLAITQ